MTAGQLSLILVRLLAGIGSLGIGTWFLATAVVEPSLGAAVLSMSIIIVGHLVLDLVWAGLQHSERTASTSVSNGERDPGESGQAGLRESATLYVSTPAVVLGLLAAFTGQSKASDTIKVGGVSLVIAIVLGIVLHGLLAYPLTEREAPRVFLAHVFNVVFWSLTFGVLCVALAIAID